MSNELMSVDLPAVWRYLVRRSWIIVLVSLIAAGGTWFFLKACPSYQSRAILMVQPGETAAQAGGVEPGDLLELALSAQVMEKTSQGFSQTFGKNPPTLQAQLTIQKRLLLMSKGTDPAAATAALELWIRELEKEYEKTFQLNLIQQKKRQENVLRDLAGRYKELEAEYRQFLAREQPVVLQEALTATLAEYSKLVESQLKAERELAANQAAQSQLREMIASEAGAGGEWKGLLGQGAATTRPNGGKNATSVKDITAQLNRLREQIKEYKLAHRTGELEAFQDIQTKVLVGLEKHLATLNNRQNSVQSQIRSLEFALRNTPEFTETRTPNMVHQLITADKIRAQAALASTSEQVASCSRAIVELKQNLAGTIEQSVRTSSDLKKLENDQQSLAKIHEQLFGNFIRICRRYWTTAADDQVLERVKRADRVTAELLRNRLQELTTRSLSVSGRDQRYQADLAETKKNINQASAKILQLNMMTGASPEAIKTVLSPSEPRLPTMDPLKAALIVGILTLGLLGVMFLVIGGAKNAR